MTLEEKMRMAIKVGEESLKTGDCPVGAVIFLNDEVISSAYSTGESNRRFLHHAEMTALWEADQKCYSIKERRQMQLFVTLEPCMMCMGAATSFFIGQIYYAMESPMDGAADFAQRLWRPDNKEIPAHQLPEIHKGLLREESKEPLRRYIEMKGKGAMVDFAKRLIKL